MNRNTRRNTRRNRRGSVAAPSNSVTQGLNRIVSTLKDLTIVTQDKGLPARRDRLPMPTPRRPQVHTIRRTYTAGQVTADNSGEGAAYAFTLSSTPGYTELTSLFDQYRIIEARAQFIPLTQEFGPSTNPSVQFPVVLSWIDLDDNITPTSAPEGNQYDTIMTVSNQTYFERVLQPRAANAMYSGSFTSYGSASPFQWMDVASPDIQYYGLKWWTTIAGDLTTNPTYKLYDVVVTLTIQLRASR